MMIVSAVLQSLFRSIFFNILKTIYNRFKYGGIERAYYQNMIDDNNIMIICAM
jgi:hypothetical protein